jgi:hypothetical protein
MTHHMGRNFKSKHFRNSEMLYSKLIWFYHIWGCCIDYASFQSNKIIFPIVWNDYKKISQFNHRLCIDENVDLFTSLYKSQKVWTTVKLAHVVTSQILIRLRCCSIPTFTSAQNIIYLIKDDTSYGKKF